MQKKFALIGFPLNHSLSAIIHKKLFDMANIKNITYNLFEISPNNIYTFLLKNINQLDGFNVTMPYKTLIYKNIEKLDETAKKFKSVNTAIKIKKNCYKGYNTDGFGFLKSLKTKNIVLKGHVLILGFGGAAKTILNLTTNSGCYTTIAVRESSIKKTKQFIDISFNKKQQKRIKIENILTPKKLPYTIIINATPIGMQKTKNMLPISKDILYYTKAAIDLIYAPYKTKFLKTATDLNIKTLNGLNMLIYQAIKANELFCQKIHKKYAHNKIKKELKKYIC